jgi:heavy metal translocating P-type ATPase
MKLYNLRKWSLPIGMVILIILAIIPGQKGLFRFNIAIIPLLLGGGFIAYNTIIILLETRRITAGLLVVFALVGSAYVGEYLAGAIVALMMISGEFLENITLDKTRNAVRRLIKLVPETALVQRNGIWQEVPVSSLLADEKILVKPGENIPVDGTVESGYATIDESTLTGESMPVDKSQGDSVFAGTINKVGSIEIIVNKIGQDSTLGRIIKIIYEAQHKKGRNQRIADRFAQYFTPAILFICVIVWFATYDLIRVMSVLVVACPCALVLATPTAVVACIGNSAKRGILIKGGNIIEAMTNVNAIMFDKTGTITVGKPKLIKTFSFNDHNPDYILALSASVEFRSEHPIAQSIVESARERGLSFIPSESFEQMPGIGVRSENVYIGNEKILDLFAHDDIEMAKDIAKSEAEKGHKTLFVIENNVIIGGLSLADTINSETSNVIDQIRKIGINHIIMLTGDNRVTAANIAGQAGITEFQAELLPEDKLNHVKQTQARGFNVAMVGDGVNDAPALTQADVGIAMGSTGTDIAIESADIVLMNNDLNHIPYILNISRRTVKIIKQNIWFFAVGVNVFGISLASSGLLSPIFGAVLHNVSSLFVVLNSARMLGFNPTKNLPN